ncbi:MAG: glycosyltransferase family 1 protein, partial [Lentisphaeraceae bacterium]|nr:glycosyltransferase family 1 protein [Lentisphaeraceae bacterium]
MKVLLLVQAEQRIILDELYDSICEYSIDCDLRWLSDNEQANLKKYFSVNVISEKYDRIVMFLRFKKELKQIKFIQTVPNLVVLEHDAWQNYAKSKYTGKFSRYYSKLPWARVICSGYILQDKLQQEGYDAVCVPKGYASFLGNDALERDIELGFVGSLKSSTYNQRKEFLEELADQHGLCLMRTASGGDYKKALNRIRFFISADIGFGEYMVKNYEAMACGCVLFAYDQGERENERLEFVDMRNVVLYRNISDLLDKLKILRADERLASSIPLAGQ